jgi:hypothetical protein
MGATDSHKLSGLQLWGRDAKEDRTSEQRQTERLYTSIERKMLGGLIG